MSPPSVEYYANDQKFINDLALANDISDLEIINDRIINVGVDSSGFTLYKIRKLYLSNMGLDSLPQSVQWLDSLTVLVLSENKLKHITESICAVYDQLDTLNIINNDICTPSVPVCIINSMTVSAFYANQQCEIVPDEDDRAFITELITENWGDSASIELISDLNNLTTWTNFVEGDAITSRITEIRYDGKGIQTIPSTIADLDSLERIELQDNQIAIIPNYIGGLSRLKYITLQKNNITSIPPLIKNLQKLEVFKIYENKLDSIHSNIGQLSKLTSLYLSENNLKTLPDSMCNILSNPDIDINVDNNQICTDYPGCFIELIQNSVQDCP